jgi:protein-L-isoaspartate(D-aspartate) O-methyltransferase
MVELIVRRGVRDPAVLAAMRKVPREHFVAPDRAHRAYDDTPLPIGEGQTISQPYIVAAMTEALQLRPCDRVLEIGTGSGYAAAVLGRIAAEVYTVECLERLAESAQCRLQELGFGNVHVRHGDGSLGWPEHAPYDAIVVTAGGPDVPRSLLRQMAVGGRLVMPVGPTTRSQRLVRIVRTGEETYDREWLEDVAFVPLIGAEGWSAEEARR